MRNKLNKVLPKYVSFNYLDLTSPVHCSHYYYIFWFIFFQEQDFLYVQFTYTKPLRVAAIIFMYKYTYSIFLIKDFRGSFTLCCVSATLGSYGIIQFQSIKYFQLVFNSFKNEIFNIKKMLFTYYFLKHSLYENLMQK